MCAAVGIRSVALLAVLIVGRGHHYLAFNLKLASIHMGTLLLFKSHRRPLKPLWLFVVAVLSYPFADTTALAQSSVTFWVNPGTGNWLTSGNWSDGVPGGISALVNNGGTAQLIGAGTAGDVILGQNPGHVGNLEISELPAGTTMLNIVGTRGGALVVGGGGRGMLTVSNGAAVASNIGVIGLGGEASSAILSGDGTQWTNTTNLSVVHGTLIVAEGATVSSASGEIGDDVGPSSATVGAERRRLEHFGHLRDRHLRARQPLDHRRRERERRHESQIGRFGTVNVGVGTASGVVTAARLEMLGTLNFNHTDTRTVSVPLVGPGFVTKNGSGIATLSDVAAFDGSYTVNAGLLILQNDVNPASILNANNGGTLRLDGLITGGSNFLNSPERRGHGRVSQHHTERRPVARAGNAPFAGRRHRRFFWRDGVQYAPALCRTAWRISSTSPTARPSRNNAPLFFEAGSNAAGGTITINNAFNTQDFANLGVIVVNSGGVLNNSVGNLTFGGGSRTTVNQGGAIQLLPGTRIDLLGAVGEPWTDHRTGQRQLRLIG